MSTRTGSCHRCGRELKGAIETNFMSLGRLVCITTIETPECNWTRCQVCRKSVCKACYLSIAGKCAYCYVEKQVRLRPNGASSNDESPEGTPEPPIRFKKAA